MRKLYSFEILNCLRLLTAVITRIDSEELSSLVYPLVQVLEAYAKLQPATEFMPLRLHLVDLLIEISERTGVFVPYALTLAHQQLQCKEFAKSKPKTAENAQCELALLYQISEKNLKSTSFWAALFTEVLKKFYRIGSLYTRLTAAPELLSHLRKVLRDEYSAVKFSGYRIQIK